MKNNMDFSKKGQGFIYSPSDNYDPRMDGTLE